MSVVVRITWSDMVAQIAIAGAGPTGAALALLLVKRGIPVTLIEAAKDFKRVFRGEGLMPSGLDALKQMGLTTMLDRVPHRQLDAWEFIFDNKRLFRVEEPMGAERPCTLVSQPPFLEALIEEAQKYAEFNFIQGVSVKELLWMNNRVAGVELSDGREVSANLTIGADGRSSAVRQHARLQLVRKPKTIDILWFKLAASPQFAADNVFYTILKDEQTFSIFHGAEGGKLHLAWVISSEDRAKGNETEWAEAFASRSPSWLAEHFRRYADTIEAPIRLSVAVGRCPRWYAPGLLLLGDAAHPMSPVRAQGINMALRDVIVAANHLVPLLGEARDEEIDAALERIQAEREPEIIRAQQLQQKEAAQGEKLRKNAFLRGILIQSPPLVRQIVRQLWLRRQQKMRRGITSVDLAV